MLKSFFISLLSFLVLDFLWLGVIMKKFSVQQLSEVARIENGTIQVQYGFAIVVYLFMALAVSVFILPRIPDGSSFFQVFLWGALMGLIIYGVYDMTNLSILKNYPLAFSITDICWGTFAFGAVSVITWKMA